MKQLRVFIIFFVILVVFNFPGFSYASSEIPSISIQSPSAILIHADSGIILYEKNSKERMFPASTTKIMTAILVIESEHDLSELATVSENAVASIPDGYSHANLKVDEQFTLEQLLDVLMLPSANDAANVLAEHISGSVAAFSNLMNEKAIEIGCLDTHFVNPSGIHSENHYSTAYDLSLIGRYAMQDETFRSIVSKTSCSLPATEKYPFEDRVFNNSNRLLYSDDIYYYPYAIGIKTGFTTPAGDCLVSATSYNDLSFIAVILGGDIDNDEISQRYSDTISLFRFAYNNYVIHTFKNKWDFVQKIEVENASLDTRNLNLLCDNNISALVAVNQIDDINGEIILNQNISAPIREGEILGKIKYSMLGVSYEANLIAENNVDVTPIFKYILKPIFIILLILLILFIIFRKKKNNFYEINNVRF